MPQGTQAMVFLLVVLAAFAAGFINAVAGGGPGKRVNLVTPRPHAEERAQRVSRSTRARLEYGIGGSLALSS